MLLYSMRLFCIHETCDAYEIKAYKVVVSSLFITIYVQVDAHKSAMSNHSNMLTCRLVMDFHNKQSYINRCSHSNLYVFCLSGHGSMPVGAYPSQSPMHSNAFRTTQQSMPFFELMQQLPYMQQFPHMQQYAGPSMPYQSPQNREEHRHHEGME